MGSGRNVSRVDSMVDNGVVIAGDIVVHHRAVIVNGGGLRSRYGVPVGRAITKSTGRHERIGVVAKPEAETDPHVRIVEAEPKSRPKIRGRR